MEFSDTPAPTGLRIGSTKIDMSTLTWPLSLQLHGSLLRLRLPEYTRPLVTDRLKDLNRSDEVPRDEDHWEAVAGEDHRERLLYALLPAHRHWLLVSNRTTGQMLKHGAAAWMDEVAATDNTARVKLTWWSDRGFILVPPGDAALQWRALQSMSGDDEHRPEFVFVRPPDVRPWHVHRLVKWCESRERWTEPEAVVPEHAQLLLAGFDGDLYCAEAQGAESRCVEAATHWAATHGVSVALGEASSWLPERGCRM